MASARVVILDSEIIRALNTTGMPVSNWRDQVGQQIVGVATGMAPVNNPANAKHRGGKVGTFKAGFDWERGHTGNQHLVRAIITNSADHAVYVELGRSGSSKMQIFSWTAWGGQIRRIGGPRTGPRARRLPKRMGSRTGPRAGKHILENAANAVVGLGA